MWSDNQKRIFCRLAFLLICALPTAVTVYRILHPQTASQWEQKLQAQLGVRTQIDSVETPGPYETILRGLKFFDAEGNQEICDATELRILFGDVNRIWIDHPVWLRSDGLQHIVEQINQRAIRGHSIEPRWIVSIRSAVVASDLVKDDHFGVLKPRELWLEKLVVDMETSADATATRFDFQLVDPTNPHSTEAPNVVSCFLERERSSSTPTNADPQQQIIVNTGTTKLPCWLVNQWLPEIAQKLGNEVAFAGSLEMDTGSPELQGFAQGQFYNVDLERVTGLPFESTRLDRWGTIDLQSFEFRSDGVQHVAYLSSPGEGTPRVRIDKSLEVIERFDLGQAIRNAALEKYRQSTGHTLRRRITYPANIRMAESNSETNQFPASN